MELFAWQKEVREICKTRDSFALFCDPGTGKSFATISILKDKLELDPTLKVLIFAPPVVCNNWKHELIKFYPEVDRSKILVADAETRKKLPDLSKYQIIIINYQAFQCPKKSYANFFGKWYPNFLIIDESHMCKSYSAKRTKNIIEFCKYAKYRYILSGSPLLNNEMDVYSQFLLMNQGKTFGDNFFVFRARYFYNVMEGRGVTFPKYVPIKSKMPELYEKIKENSYRITLKEVVDLPPLVESTIKIPMHPSVRKVYNDLRDEFIAFIDDKAVVAQTAMTKALRLMQVCTGHYVTDEKEVKTLNHNSKLEALENFIQDNIDIHKKIIIWCSFKHDYKIIGQMLTENKIKHVFITGEQSTKEKEESVQAFQNGDAQVVVGNRKSGGVGINLVAAPCSIVFSKTFDLADEIQSSARNYRKGSEIHEKVLQYDLVYEDSIDEKITLALALKGKMMHNLSASDIASLIKTEGRSI